MEWDMGPPQTHYFCLLLSQISLYYFLSRLINSPLMVACSLMIPDKLMFSLLQTARLTINYLSRSLFTANERIKTEYCNLQTDYKTLKTENNQMKLRTTEMQGKKNTTSLENILATYVYIIFV